MILSILYNQNFFVRMRSETAALYCKLHVHNLSETWSSIPQFNLIVYQASFRILLVLKAIWFWDYVTVILSCYDTNFPVFDSAIQTRHEIKGSTFISVLITWKNKFCFGNLILCYYEIDPIFAIRGITALIDHRCEVGQFFSFAGVYLGWVILYATNYSI